MFTTQVFIEGLEGCKGIGYSKKESQQNASKDTLQRLRREPQFIDAVFAAKGDRTKMEEEPVMVAPDPEELVRQQQDFFAEPKAATQQPRQQASLIDEEMTLDDIQVTPQEQSREDIIAAAEAAAFAAGEA